MIRAVLLASLLSIVSLNGLCTAQEQPGPQPLEQQAPDLPPLTLSAVTAAVHTGAVLLDDPAQATVLDEAGCYVWQQPGVALVVTGIWQPGGTPGLLFSPDKVDQLFKHLPGLVVGEPIIYPREVGNSDEFYLEPRVYVLDAEVSRRRLATYMENFNTWAGYNLGASFIMPTEEALATDIAIVYLDSAGPLEFHFQVGAGGRLVLRHVISYEFFSA